MPTVTVLWRAQAKAPIVLFQQSQHGHLHSYRPLHFGRYVIRRQEISSYVPLARDIRALRGTDDLLRLRLWLRSDAPPSPTRRSIDMPSLLRFPFPARRTLMFLGIAGRESRKRSPPLSPRTLLIARTEFVRGKGTSAMSLFSFIQYPPAGCYAQTRPPKTSCTLPIEPKILT